MFREDYQTPEQHHNSEQYQAREEYPAREAYQAPAQQPVTYSLRAGGQDSGQYYQDIDAVTTRFLRDWGPDVSSLRERYMRWIREGRREALRDEREYSFDILTLGVLWRLYGGRVRRVPAAASLLCAALYRLRRKWPALKPRVDPLRGLLSTRFLTGDDAHDACDDTPTAADLSALLRWMDATGEYREETGRLRPLVDFLRECDPRSRNWYLAHVLGIADAFMIVAGRDLGRYTAGVDAFRGSVAGAHRNREDVLLVSRKRAEYHLSMVGAELMNRAFRGDYRRTRERAILLPACMRGTSAAHCRAQHRDLDLVCTQCDRNCRIGQLTRGARARGVSVHIIPHSSDFTRWLRDWAADRDIGVIGVACVMHLITGGLELRALGIPAQCVLLDHCGCAQHWDPDGRQTDLNGKLLHEIAMA